MAMRTPDERPANSRAVVALLMCPSAEFGSNFFAIPNVTKREPRTEESRTSAGLGIRRCNRSMMGAMNDRVRFCVITLLLMGTAVGSAQTIDATKSRSEEHTSE